MSTWATCLEVATTTTEHVVVGKFHKLCTFTHLTSNWVVEEGKVAHAWQVTHSSHEELLDHARAEQAGNTAFVSLGVLG